MPQKLKQQRVASTDADSEPDSSDSRWDSRSDSRTDSRTKKHSAKKSERKKVEKSTAQKLLERSLSPPIEFQNFDPSSIVSANHLHVSESHPPVLKPITCTHLTSKNNAAGKENQHFRLKFV